MNFVIACFILASRAMCFLKYIVPTVSEISTFYSLVESIVHILSKFFYWEDLGTECSL